MPAVERMTITMPADLAETLRGTVAGGEHAYTSEVMREALREWSRGRDAERRDLEMPCARRSRSDWRAVRASR